MKNYKATMKGGREFTFPAKCQRHANNIASRIAGKSGLQVKEVKQC